MTESLDTEMPNTGTSGFVVDGHYILVNSLILQEACPANSFNDTSGLEPGPSLVSCRLWQSWRQQALAPVRWRRSTELMRRLEGSKTRKRESSSQVGIASHM